MMEECGGFLTGLVYREILDELSIGVYICDIAGKILYINDAYAEVIGISKDMLVNRNIVEVLPNLRTLDTMTFWSKKVDDLCVIGSGEDKKTTIVNRLPIHDKDGRIVGMASICLFRTPGELKALLEKVEQLDSRVSFYRRRMESALSARYTLENILGESKAIVLAKQRLHNYAQTDFPVLIQGQTGTGKELFANALHASSKCKNGPFVSINCAAIPIELFESEIFGYSGGAFSGASKDGKVGLIELADGGTLFLDEIGDMPLGAQSKLLRVLEEKIVYRVGSSRPYSVNFRLVVATTRELIKLVEQGEFREDLYYRISALPLQVPPLSDRKSDIPIIVSSLLNRMEKEYINIYEDAMNALKKYDWPGNIRELRNVLIEAISVSDNISIKIKDLPKKFRSLLNEDNSINNNDFAISSEKEGFDKEVPSQYVLDKHNIFNLYMRNNIYEMDYIVKSLDKNNWNMSKTARYLQISRATLYEKCKKYGIKRRVK